MDEFDLKTQIFLGVLYIMHFPFPLKQIPKILTLANPSNLFDFSPSEGSFHVFFNSIISTINEGNCISAPREGNIYRTLMNGQIFLRLYRSQTSI